MRNRFKASRICSLDNYKLSRRTHIRYIRAIHDSNTSLLGERIKDPYIKVFDKLLKVSSTELATLDNSIKITWI